MSLPEPYYQRGPVTIYRGDCLELLPHLPRVDAVVTDPPYGIGYVKGGGGKDGLYCGRKSKIRNTEAISGDDKPFDPSLFLIFDNVLMWGADHFAQRLPHGRWLAWNKLGDKDPWDSFSDVEFAWHNRKGAARIITALWKGLCQGAGEDKGSTRDHPTQKPVAVMRWSIEQAGTTEGDTILDPFLGSGTTAVACIRTGRQCIGIELEERYCEIAAKRCDRELDQGRLPFDAPAKRVETQRELFAEVTQ